MPAARVDSSAGVEELDGHHGSIAWKRRPNMYRPITWMFLLGICCLAPVATRAGIIVDPSGDGQPHDNVQPSLAINHIIALEGAFPPRNKDDKGAEPYLGEVDLFAGNFAPRGWALCDGQILPIDQHQSLFSLLGTTYGGDGRTTFGLPDLRGRTAVHPGTGTGLTSRQPGERFGAQNVTLTVGQLPAHSHTIQSPLLHRDFVTFDTGGNQPHTNMQPSLGLNYTIALQGVFPSRNKSTDSFIGEIDLFAGNFAPRDRAFPNGQLLSIAENTALFSLVGTIYGGDGRTTFGLPDLQGRAVVHEGDGPGLTDRRLGERIGVEEVALTEAQLTNHGHHWEDSFGVREGSTDPTGGGQPHDNVQPSLALNYIIALEGLFPSRNKQNKGAQPFIGEVSLFAGNFAPRDWAFCDGQLVPIAQNNALFSLLGTTYGGDGRTTFGLPDLRGRVAVHPGQGPGLPSWRLGQEAGTENVAPNSSQMAAHDHVVIPEPSTFVLAALGLLTLGLAAWRRPRK